MRCTPGSIVIQALAPLQSPKSRMNIKVPTPASSGKKRKELTVGTRTGWQTRQSLACSRTGRSLSARKDKKTEKWGNQVAAQQTKKNWGFYKFWCNEREHTQPCVLNTFQCKPNALDSMFNNTSREQLHAGGKTICTVRFSQRKDTVEGEKRKSSSIKLALCCHIVTLPDQ